MTKTKIIDTGKGGRKAVTIPSNAHLLSLYFSVASCFKLVKRHCLDNGGRLIQSDGFLLLLALVGFGRTGITSSALHLVVNFGDCSLGVRTTRNRLSCFVGCGLVTRSNGLYRLSLQAEKLLFSEISKSDLVEVSNMVGSILEEEKALQRAKRLKKSLRK